MRSYCNLLSRAWLSLVGVLIASATVAQGVAPAPLPAPAPLAAQVRFVTTMGAFTIELDGARAPLSTLNFLQ